MAGKTAQAIADLVAETIHKQRGAQFHHESNMRQATTTAQMETMEQELAVRWQEIMDVMLPAGELHPDLQPFFGHLTEPGHQSDFLFQIFAILGMVLVGLPNAAAGKAGLWRQQSMINWGDEPLAPEVVAQLRARSLVGEGGLADYARRNGFSDETMAYLTEATRTSPTVTEGFAMVNRNIVGEGTLRDILQQTGLRPEYVDAVARLRVNPPSTEEALIAELEGYLTAGEVEEIMRLNGDDPAAHSWRFESRGQPPPISELVRIWRRGFLTDQQIHDAVLQGPLKNEYIPAVMKFKEVLPTFRQVLNMVGTHILTESEGLDLLIQNGYSPYLAGKMLDYATRQKMAAEHGETKAEIVASYDLRLIDRTQATTMLQHLSFTMEAVEAVLNLADAKRDRRLLEEGIGRVRTQYVGWHSTENEASALLDRLHVPTDYRDDLMHTWQIERETATKHLTPAQVAGAWARGLLDDTEALTELRADGYSERNAQIILGLQTPKPKAAKT